MCRDNLIHTDNLINSISVTAFIVLRLYRLGNLTLLEILDSEPVFGSAI